MPSQGFLSISTSGGHLSGAESRPFLRELVELELSVDLLVVDEAIIDESDGSMAHTKAKAEVSHGKSSSRGIDNWQRNDRILAGSLARAASRAARGFRCSRSREVHSVRGNRHKGRCGRVKGAGAAKTRRTGIPVKAGRSRLLRALLRKVDCPGR